MRYCFFRTRKDDVRPLCFVGIFILQVFYVELLKNYNYFKELIFWSVVVAIRIKYRRIDN